MLKKIVVLIVIIIFILIFYFKFLNKEKKTVEKTSEDTSLYNSNLLENVEYTAKDSKGNQYIIKAASGEIDLNNNQIIFLKDVTYLVKLTNSDIHCH